MFKREMWIVSGLLLPVLLFWIYQTTIVRSSDLALYQKWVEKRDIAASTSNPTETNQKRKRVRKDIWFSQDDHSRLHYQITSESSHLTLTPIKNSFEIVEFLQGVKCWMQDKLFISDAKNEPLQQARLIEAENGLYRYSTQEFTANGVVLSLFRLPGHALPTIPINKNAAFLRGIAKDVSFLFSGKTPQFQARNFESMVEKE